MFSITTEHRNKITFYILRNEANGEQAEIIPDIGATVHALRLCMNGTVKDVLSRDKEEEIIANPLFRGRVLFPFNDLIPNGVYAFNNTTYTLNLNSAIDSIALHGFVSDRKFTIVEQESTYVFCRLTLQTMFREDEFRGYPFSCLLQVTYTLREHAFTIHFLIRNTGTSPAPLSFGWHPYFTFDGSIKDTFCTIHTDRFCETDASHLPTRRMLECADTDFDFRHGKRIDDLAIDHALIAPSDGAIVLSQGADTITVYQDPTTFKYVQIYSPKDQQSIAIEPVTAAPNCFNFHELGLITLEPGQEIKTFISVKTKNE